MAACSSSGLTSSTSDRDMPGLHVRPSHSHLELKEWMARIQESLQSVEDSVLKQSVATESLAIGVHELLQFGFREGSLQEAVPEGGKIVRPLRIEVPQDAPTPLPCIPCDLPCELGPVPERTEDSLDQGDGLTSTLAKVVSRRRSRHSSGGEERAEVEKFLASRDPQSTQYGMMHELEEHNAFRLMHVRRNGRAHSHKKLKKSSSRGPEVASDLNPDERDPDLSQTDVPETPKKRAPTITSRVGGEDKEVMLSRVRRVSLEDLRNNYDAVVVHNFNGKVRDPTITFELGKTSALSTVARLLLCVTGILQFRMGPLWRLFSWCLNVSVSVCLSAFLIYYNVWHPNADISFSTALLGFIACLFLATIGLKRVQIGRLLGPEESYLDDYAAEAGFLQDWWKVSRRRFFEVGGFWFTMLALKALANFVGTGSVLSTMLDVQDIGVGVAFWIMSFYYALMCYTHLHICCGLELAVDGFGLRFFKEMDVEQALEEWSQVQAILRQASRKISNSLLLLGMACLATLAILAEKVIQAPAHFSEIGDLLHWILWFYPLITL
ncbi:unnamed protein product, partial [Symbiodinium sp. CCMP2456]